MHLGVVGPEDVLITSGPKRPLKSGTETSKTLGVTMGIVVWLDRKEESRIQVLHIIVRSTVQGRQDVTELHNDHKRPRVTTNEHIFNPGTGPPLSLSDTANLYSLQRYVF